MKNKSLLIMRLEGALQAWGEQSKWDFRDSSDFPTKSGIVGLIGCAMGLERGSPKLAEINDSINVAIRADRPGSRTIDFQTVTGNPLLNALGKPKSTGNTIVSQHAYLQDACFTVILEAEEDLISEIRDAIKNPKWCIYLGRKNCVPSRPLLENSNEKYASLEDAVRSYPPAERASRLMTFEIEQAAPGMASYLRADNCLSGERQFALRTVWRGVIEGENDVSVTD